VFLIAASAVCEIRSPDALVIKYLTPLPDKLVTVSEPEMYGELSIILFIF
jgi:hypothetical protein